MKSVKVYALPLVHLENSVFGTSATDTKINTLLNSRVF